MTVNNYRLDLLNGVHQPGDIYMMALYNRPLDVSVSVYVTNGEALGPGYRAGGARLEGRKTLLVEGVATLGWNSPTWVNSTLVASFALIYNYTKQNRAVTVLDLGGTFTSSNGPFTVELPPELISLGG